MESISLLISILFFLAALISIFWGIYIIRLNGKQRVNRAFFFLCLTLSIWSFGFAMANISNSLDMALFWRRFSSIGMTSIFGIILHFLILFTREKENGKLDKTIYLIHIPALICIYVFAFSPSGAMLQYDLVKTEYGLTNIASNSLWNYFYYSYYALYMILSLSIVWNWKKRLKEKTKIKQANIIFGAIILASIGGSLTDVLWTTYMSKTLPQIAPLFILIPVWAMYHSARYYGVMDINKTYKKEMIVTEEDRKQIFNNLSIGFYISAILAFVSEYIPYMDEENSFKFALIKALTLAGIGMLIRIIQNIKKETIKENLTIIVLVSSIPIALLQYLKYGSVTVWAFPMVIIISSIIFSKLNLLIFTTLVSVITQVLIWIIRHEIPVVINKYDYILRIGMFIVAFFTGLYINRIYIGKIEENEFQISFQKMNAKISSDLISINKENKDEKISSFLGKMALFFEADRTYLFLIDHGDSTMTYSYEWCNEGIEEEVGTIEKIPLNVFPWWIDQLEENKLVLVEDVNNMPKEAINEQDQLLKQNVKTLVSVPLEGGEKIKGFIGIDSVKFYRKWTEQDIKLLNILSNLLSDALARIKSEEKIEYMAYYDNLTKLPNRFLFKYRVQSAINLAKRRGSLISIIFIDLDNFKSVNDTIGHDGGDYLLREVAKKLVGRVRKTDTVARFGGDEFMILLNNIENQNDIYKIAENVMDIFSKPFDIYGQEFFVTASGGISMLSIDGEDPETLIKNADTAMYEAKAKGKNGFEFCTDNMKEEVEKNMTMTKDLYYALERNELAVYYQPQMDLDKKKITGLEALLRWKHPKLGMIPPKVFIPIAEKNGLINSIGEWVLKTACDQNKKWQDMGLGKLKIGVNLSGMQFINANIAEDISRILEETALEAKYLELEITENIAIRETDFVVEVLNKLKKIGVSIAIDDFGTEYSSLSRLKLLPIDRIKIDMEFIHGIENNEKDKAITVIIINLAKSLGLNVLAEGVETAPQLEFLNQKMCDYVQGFYYYKPMPAEEMEEILKAALIISEDLDDDSYYVG